MEGLVDPSFWRGKRVLVTGHSGFKGAWLTLWLLEMGAEVTGFSRRVPSEPSLFELAGLDREVGATDLEIGDAAQIERAVAESRPDVVLHLAAQALVRVSYTNPVDTYNTIVMGTVNLLEAVRRADRECVVIVVTSDKCYENQEWEWGYREDDRLGGHDPYSNAKACSELVTQAYRDSFFGEGSPVKVASVRAGNVVGGGDWGADRLIPDLMRAAVAGETLRVRNPNAIRPWQHVLNPLSGYLLLAQRLAEGTADPAAWNFGPPDDDVRPVEWIVRRLAERWGEELTWTTDEGPHPHEATFLKLDSSRARLRLGWTPAWDLDRALTEIADWYRGHAEGGDARERTLAQIRSFASVRYVESSP